MIKLVVFDLDGVLVEAKMIHYHALNRALLEYANIQIEWEEHLARYDGLPTRKKLEKLTVEKGLSPDLYNKVWQGKQEHTIAVIRELIIPFDHNIQRETLAWLIQNGYRVFVASNSISASIYEMLKCARLLEYVHRYYSNEDVRNPKPHAEIYLRCMVDAGVNPKETLVVEDSHIGRKSAHESGAQLMGVINSKDVTIHNMEKAINKANQYQMFRPKWQGGKMNVLIPMAGAGTRFEKAGYTFPKPLIDVHGKPMIQVIVENINVQAQHIFICQKSHYEQYNLQHVLNLIAPNCKIVQVDHITDGAACTTLLAKDLINNDDPLLIANSDQFVEWDSNEFLYSCNTDNIDGGILTFTNTHPKWSYARLDENGYVTEVKEKQPISNIATVGIYFWRHGSDYVKYAEQMIRKNIRVNNEFYVCPVFNEAIADGKKFKTFHVDIMFGTGTPEDLNYFLQNYPKEKI